MQILSWALETNSEDVDVTPHQFHTITLNFNELPTHIMVQLQNTMIQELADREEIIGDHLMKLQEEEEMMKKKIERLKKAQDLEIM